MRAIAGIAKGALIAAAALALTLTLVACTQPNTKDTTNDSQAAATSTPEQTAPPSVTLQVFAANSLEKALPEVQALYTQKHPEVTFADTQFKASGDLVEQINAGAQPDILITASKGSMDTAVDNGAINESTRIDMFANDLVIVKAKGADITINSLDDVTQFSKIAIGDAATVPAGQYANQTLNSIGLYSSDTGKDGQYLGAIADKVVLADKVGTAASYVSTGNCQIGFVYTSDLYRYEGIEIAFTVPADAHKPILYPGALLNTTAHSDVANDFLNFCLTDPDALSIWSKFGFEVL